MSEDKIIRAGLDADWQFFFMCILVIAILGVIALAIWTWQMDFIPKTLPYAPKGLPNSMR
jgi:hypothetical protein